MPSSVHSDNRKHRSSRELIYKKGEVELEEPSKSNNNDEDLDGSFRSKCSSSGSTASRKSRRSLSTSRKPSSASSNRSLSGSRKSRSSRHVNSPTRSRNSTSNSIGSSIGNSASASTSTSNSTSPMRSSSRSVGTGTSNNRRRGGRRASSRGRRSKSDRHGMGDLGSRTSVTSRNTISTFPSSSADLSRESDAVENTSVSNSSNHHVDADVKNVANGRKDDRRRSSSRSSNRRRLKSEENVGNGSSHVDNNNSSNNNNNNNRRSGTSRSSSRRQLKKDRSKRSITGDQHTTASSTVDLLYYDTDPTNDDDLKSKSSKQSYKRASRPGVERVLDSPNYKSDSYNKTESLTSDSSHSKNLWVSNHSKNLKVSNHSKSSKRTNGTRSSKHILYGEDDEDLKMKTKSKSPKGTSQPGVEPWYDNITKPGVERWYDNDPRSRDKNVLYGVEEEEYKKRSKKRSKAHRPGIERVQGARDLLYGEEEAKKLAMQEARYGSSSRAARNDDGYSYDFPIATGPRESYGSSSLMVDSDIPADEPSISARSEDASQANATATGITRTRTRTRNGLKSVRAGSVKLVEENEPGKKKRSTTCLIGGILFALLVLVLGVVGGFILLSKSSEEEGAQVLSATNETVAPTDLVTFLPPTQAPTNTPTFSPTESTRYDPPSEQDCEDIANNRTLAGQGDLLREDFSINFDVTLSRNGDIGEDEVNELLDALERLFVPKMVGCAEVDTGRRRLGSEQQPQRKLNSRYVIGNADVTVIENTDFNGQAVEDVECSLDFTAEPDKCHVVEVGMTVYLKGPAKTLEIVTVITNVGKGNLVPALQLSDAFSEVYLSTFGDSSDAPSVSVSSSPTDLPSVVPSAWPSTSPSFSPSDSPVVGPSPPPTPPPTGLPSKAPSLSPTIQATPGPTLPPTRVPSTFPSQSPSLSPVLGLTPPPSPPPTTAPTIAPTVSPTEAPTPSPTSAPTPAPTSGPTSMPTTAPTFQPTSTPTRSPTSSPTSPPTSEPTSSPTSSPTAQCYCTSADACDATASDFQIGCDSCIQTDACTTLTQSAAGSFPFTVGERSCVGSESCQGASVVTIGDDSCTGTQSCRGRQINLGSGSCTDEQSCDVQPDTLVFWSAARLELLTVGSNSCTGPNSCYSYYGTVGSGSCTGARSCAERLQMNIGDSSCLGEESCAAIRPVSCGLFCWTPLRPDGGIGPNTITVADNSCQGARSCRCMTNVLLANSCNTLNECCDEDNPDVYAPGFTATSFLN